MRHSMRAADCLADAIARRDGALQIITFDAQAVFHEFTVKTLDPAITLRQPNVNPPITAPQESTAHARNSLGRDCRGEAELVMFNKQIWRLAQAELDMSIDGRAQQAEWESNESTRQEKTMLRSRAERLVSVAKARHNIQLQNWHCIARLPIRKRPRKKLLKQPKSPWKRQTRHSKTEIKPNDYLCKNHGANWTPTRFMNSGKDESRG